MIASIKTLARQHMAENGAAALSLGAIARALNITTPALYRYFDSRDALITALILDSYQELGEEVNAAVAARAGASLEERWLALTDAYRTWALSHPQLYQLVHGTSFAGYVPKIEPIANAAAGTLQAFVSLLEEAHAAGCLKIPSVYTRADSPLWAGMGPLGPDLPVPLVALGFLCWLPLHGLVYEEISGRLPGELFRNGSLYRLEALAIAERLGLSG